VGAARGTNRPNCRRTLGSATNETDGIASPTATVTVTATTAATTKTAEEPSPKPTKSTKPTPKKKQEPQTEPGARVSKRQWAKIVRKPESYKGDKYIIYGQVTQFDSATDDDSFLADTAHRNTMSYGFFDGENTLLSGNAKQLDDLVEDDVFRASVTVLGKWTTTPRLAATPQSRCFRSTASRSSDRRSCG
jgi:hypothetical protein